MTSVFFTRLDLVRMELGMLVSRDVFQEQIESEISHSTLLHFYFCNKIGLFSTS